LAPGTIALGVPCYREADRIPVLAAAIAALDPQPGCIIAVDDGSADRTGQLLIDAGYEVLRHDRNLGLGTARNSLWRRAEDFGMTAIAYLDADVIPPVNYIAEVGRLLGGDRIAGVGGRNVDDAAISRTDRWRGRFWEQGLGARPLMDAPMLVGACASYRIDVLKDVGGFNPRFKTHGEDVELGRRLRLQGHRLRYDPDLVVHHQRVDRPRDLMAHCYLHCREGMRATLSSSGDGPGPGSLALGMGRKLLRAPAASLLKRGDPLEAALGVAACTAGLLGYAAGWTRP